MNIFEAIREDHEKQRTLVNFLVKTHGDTEERKELFNTLKFALKDHADAEEKFFYAPLIKSDLTQDKARHGIAEHHEIDEILAELDKTDMSSPQWLTLAKKLKKEVEHHLDEEEHGIFQMAGKVLTDDQKILLAEKFNKARKHTSDVD
ncbi:hemerythrin domain-containing protein [Fulvivirga sp. M361]|uniref:hemerythrin domain-containing protein n=1 Tax=Fulvivirga sp. M361 TaxID=2594266 RepID=UPI00117AC624|nr:hemerythrin domain-containing protein [Fulvivirga sp. M361]TRX60511.1 hemerythrin domain-containing protein [Fulvivirga sp. M361]